MRLLHTRDLRFEEFSDDGIPYYAILSHTWGTDEVSYQQLLTGCDKQSAGYIKIKDCCKYVARKPIAFDSGADKVRYWWSNLSGWTEVFDDDWVWIDTLDWVWIDTCCIDKSSSSELSEAINSMYHWYSNATTCVALLADVDSRKADFRLRIANSKWFTRGWTLQELLAPDDVSLVDRGWRLLGAKDDLLDLISTYTSITRSRLEKGHLQIAGGTDQMISIAEMFSWAADRRTTRTEDAAYCLMGIFSVNMPLLYGERQKAFLRLQQEIIRTSNDESIFAWHLTAGFGYERTGLLAPSPKEYNNAVLAPDGQFTKIPSLQRPPYTITNQGLQLQVPSEYARGISMMFPLNCRYYENKILIGVYAVALIKDATTGVWWRICSKKYSGWRDPVGDRTGLSEADGDYGLFIVPESDVWSQADLERSGSRTIYAHIHGHQKIQTY